MELREREGNQLIFNAFLSHSGLVNLSTYLNLTIILGRGNTSSTLQMRQLSLRETNAGLIHTAKSIDEI